MFGRPTQFFSPMRRISCHSDLPTRSASSDFSFGQLGLHLLQQYNARNCYRASSGVFPGHPFVWRSDFSTSPLALKKKRTASSDSVEATEESEQASKYRKSLFLPQTDFSIRFSTDRDKQLTEICSSGDLYKWQVRLRIYMPLYL
jgi:hypothetical protein